MLLSVLQRMSVFKPLLPKSGLIAERANFWSRLRRLKGDRIALLQRSYMFIDRDRTKDRRGSEERKNTK